MNTLLLHSSLVKKLNEICRNVFKKKKKRRENTNLLVNWRLISLFSFFFRLRTDRSDIFFSTIAIANRLWFLFSCEFFLHFVFSFFFSNLFFFLPSILFAGKHSLLHQKKEHCQKITFSFKPFSSTTPPFSKSELFCVAK